MAKAKSSVKKQLLVVGDRVLVKPTLSQGKTHHGLYLPQGVEEKEKVQTGIVMKTGPGYPMPDPASVDDEPWSRSRHDTKYIPLQVEEGDQVIYLRKSAVELEYERETYLIIPHSAILLIVREDLLGGLSDGDNE